MFVLTEKRAFSKYFSILVHVQLLFILVQNENHAGYSFSIRMRLLFLLM